MSYSGPKPRVAFQGEHGAFSEDAAIKLLGPAIELVPRRTFMELFSCVDEGRADYVLAPVENTLAGAVEPTIELLRESALVVADEVIIRVEQQLIGCPGAVFDEVEAVESHPVALAQCRSFFADNPQILMIESDDTAGSVARIIARGDCKRAAIASRRAAEIYGGTIIRENVEDDPENYTRFLLLSRYGEKSISNITEPSAVAPEAGGGSRGLKLAETLKSKRILASGASTTPAGLPRRGPRSALGSVMGTYRSNFRRNNR